LGRFGGASDSRDGHLLLRIDTPIEVTYSHHGGILPYFFQQLFLEAPSSLPKETI
jgi:hypothetical protein